MGCQVANFKREKSYENNYLHYYELHCYCNIRTRAWALYTLPGSLEVVLGTWRW